jgi:outer membrane receptor protein involved in Fe transport
MQSTNQGSGATARSRLLQTTSAAVLLILAQGAFATAHAADAEPTAEAQVDEVVVTASRVARSGFTAPTPTTQVGAEELQKSNVTNIADQLNKVPSFRASSTPATTSHASQNAGGNFLDLRGLGTTRTLVLVDGIRHVPTSSNGTIDTNVIPSGLIDRVDVVTGGASAAWGSDAVAGVVNLILKRKLTGFQGEASVGQTERGDNQEYRVALSGGVDFADGRGNFMAGAEYASSRGVGSDRGWFKEHWANIANPAYVKGNGQPQNLIVPDVGVSVATLGGLITSGPLKGLQFLPGGATSQFNYGTNVGAQYMTGGDGIYPGDLVNLVTPVERGVFLARTTFEFTPTIEGFAEASLGYSGSEFNLSASYDTGTITIQKDNAFLSSDVRNMMTANNITNFKMGRINPDIGYNVVDAANVIMRTAAGLKGSLGADWTWDASFEAGRTRYSASINNNRITNNFNMAIDSVIGPNGQPICRSTLTSPGNGCVPINLFGAGSPSQASIAYVLGTQDVVSHIDEQAAAFNLQGKPFTTWAGPVSLATGVEFRRESLKQMVDPSSQAGLFAIGNPRAMKGSYDVKEIYAETVVPLAVAAPFAKNLDLNAAARFTDYSTSGSVWTWKAGLSWAINDEWRVRATRSRDIRAPNLSDLYTPYVLTFSTITDPANGRQITVSQPQVGNPDLKPEKADTVTAGIVYEPAWLSGLHMSLDYYDIKLQGAISTLSAQNIINRCTAGTTSLCQYITRNAAGDIDTVVRANINLSQLETSGMDGEISFTTPLDRYFASVPGSIDLRLLASYVDKYITDDGVTAINTGGVTGTGGPHWRGMASVTYDAGPLRLYVEGRYVGPGLYDVNLTYNNNHVESQTLVNATVQYTLRDDGDRRLQVFGTVNNLLDSDPPVAPYNFIFGSPATASVFDVIGRRYTVGMRFRY